MQPDADAAALSFRKADFEIRNTFATPVIIAAIDEADELNAELLPTILDRAARSQGVIRSNQGGWQSTDDFATWSGPAGQRLVDAAVALANTMTGLQGAEGVTRVALNWKINAWANVNRDGHGNAAHHHPGCFWSAVYWLQTAGEGGEFEIQDPRGILPGFVAPNLRYALPGCLSAGGSDFLVPTVGTLILFPSWLVHAVRPFKGTQPRVSVAINLAP
ncbi:TIGR02466 family protein [Acidisphaera sp. L21]|uniref:TIGR02466 family protein n=1 Tax=Acidisphaera sp. L21 TaxID=1641851 RepID=UPI00131BFC74|nr:TIGR02466 family protein [Acidisphaera sp. L21]